MKKVNKEVIKEASEKLLFDMNEEELEIVFQELEILSKQIELLSLIDGVDQVSPITFPYEITTSYLREDIVDEVISQEEALKNADEVENGMIRLPKVVR